MERNQPLRRILGLGFGLAMVFGGTVGVGILRMPATVAAALGDSNLIILFWVMGGVYALLGAISVAELAAMLPQAGGFYVYARRAFGGGIGFIVGWMDWINTVATLAYASITTVTFLAALWPASQGVGRYGAIFVILAFTALHWVGLRLGSGITRLISIAIGLTMLILVVTCFLVPPAAPGAVLPQSAATLPFASAAMAAALVGAIRAVLLTYDGWYSPIYLAEESVDPGRMLPRSMIGGTVVVMILYVLINIAMMRVLPRSVMAHSDLPAAAAARALFPRGGAELVTLISILTVLSLLNATLLQAPRVLFAIGRDGLFTAKAAAVSAGGTPRVALGISAAGAIALILSGTFEQIVAMATIMFLLIYISAYAALFVLRRREPATPRPYRTWGFPYTTAIVCAGCVLVLIAAIMEDLRSAIAAAVLILACAPLYAWLARRKRFGEAKALTETL
jgi:APA family basic amino acid/polyamine antiporter